MSESTRPKRVVVVDAENPLKEIRGEFFWREDHDRIVAEARESAYARGYTDGVAMASRRAPRTVVVRYRGGLLRRMVTTALVALVVVAFTISLLSTMVESVHSP